MPSSVVFPLFVWTKFVLLFFRLEEIHLEVGVAPLATSEEAQPLPLVQEKPLRWERRGAISN